MPKYGGVEGLRERQNARYRAIVDTAPDAIVTVDLDLTIQWINGTAAHIEMASQTHRVIAFDRPGFGHSARPRGTIWTPEAQADLIHLAMRKLGITRAKVLGHSWGASVAVALGLKQPEAAASLILASGYYYPTDGLTFQAPLPWLIGISAYPPL